MLDSHVFSVDSQLDFKALDLRVSGDSVLLPDVDCDICQNHLVSEKSFTNLFAVVKDRDSLVEKKCAPFKDLEKILQDNAFFLDSLE